MQKLRSHIQKNAQTDENMKFCKLLNKILESIGQFDKTDKQAALYELIDYMERSERELNMRLQNDLIRILTIIFDKLESEDESIKSFFTIECLHLCKCK